MDNDDGDDIDMDWSGQERINLRPAVSARQPSEVVVVDSTRTPSTTQPAASTSSPVGSALRRNPDGTIVAPRIAKKKKDKKVNIIFSLAPQCD